MNRTNEENGLKYFEGIFDASSEAMVIVDAEGHIVRINPAFETLLGYEIDSLRKKPFTDLVHKTPTVQKAGVYIKIYHFHRASTSPIEMKLIDKEGNTVPVKFRSVLVKNSAEEVVEAIGIVQALREGKEKNTLEQVVRESQETLHNVLANSGDDIMVCDTNGCITLVNEALLQMLGYQESELLDKHLLELAPSEGKFTTTTGEEVAISTEYLNYAGAKAIELFEQGKARYEVHLVRKDRFLVPVETTLSLLKDHHGERKGSIAICRDVSERIKAERNIKEAKEFLEDIIKTSVDGILATDAAGFITMVNNAMVTMLGYSTDEFVGKRPKDFFPNTNEYEEKNKALLTTLMECGVVTNFKSILIRKDGNPVHIELNIALQKDHQGTITGSVTSIRDITERKEMELKLFQAEKLKSLGELAGGVAHDFNNILAVILGRAQLIQMIIEPPPGMKEKRKSVCEAKKGLEIIEQAARDGAETVRRIQEFARNREDDKYLTSVDINEVIEHALEFTRVRWKDEGELKGIQFDIQKELSPLPPVRGSASELREVFTNLINNALDAMPQGGHLRITTFQEDSLITIKVEDDGAGIPQVIRNRIYDPFFTTKGPQSSGLGLSVSYGIITRHQGTLTVESIEGNGTTFIVTLPLSEDTMTPKKGKPFPENQRKARILVIDDEEAVRNLLAEILLKGGHEVVAASSGKQGVEIFEKVEFDLVFTDLGMPEMSGWQVSEKVRSINGRVAVVLLTGWDITPTASELKDKGVDLVMRKPFEVNQVIGVVQQGMELRDRSTKV